MKNYIKSCNTIGAVRELLGKIERIIAEDSFALETTAIGDLADPDKRTFLKTYDGKMVIVLAQAIIDIVKDFYEGD